jgi:hypothetical protein
MGPHHAEGLPNAKMEGTTHALGDMPPVDAESALSANHTASRKAGFARAERE